MNAVITFVHGPLRDAITKLKTELDELDKKT